ncbi:MFS transporter [Clostridium sp. OS1-26]|uniref:MFS transporter n=1 Tax=Clostridium sp. OS1-26 TaxID=3070681 RepID=UPI0027E1C490|nr:MFS transporter [Clostridium sp. OS1-26]WML37129.1 MFS transporter [Clostridium sp. OS1-26]
MPVSERYWWRVVTLCFLGWILMYADRTILNPVMGKIGKEFGLTNAQLGLASSVFFLTYAVVQIPFGMIGDKIGRKLVISLGLIGFGITTYFSGIASAFGVFMLFRALTGMAEGSFYGPSYAIATESIPTKKLTLGTAIINSGMAFGTSGGFLISSKLVLQNGEHWSKPFLLMTIPTIIVGILFYVLLKEKVIRPEDQVQGKAVQAKETDVVKEKVTLGSIFSNKNLMCTFVLCFCSIYANFVIITWLPNFLQVERGFSGTSVGFIASLVPWASIPGALIVATLSDKYKITKKFVYFLVPLALISTFGIAFVTNRTLLIVMLIVYGLTGKLALDPILVAFVTKNAKKVCYQQH